MWRRCLILIIPISLVCAVIWAISALPGYMVGIHQRSVTQELANWKNEYHIISSQHDAVRTAEMLEYVQWYYIPGEGYHSATEIEAALELQRQETISAFVASLREYTGEDFGTDSKKWLAFLKASSPDGNPTQKD